MKQEIAGLKKGLNKSREDKISRVWPLGLVRGMCNQSVGIHFKVCWKCVKTKVKIVPGEPK
jgi:hypothetical protein